MEHGDPGGCRNTHFLAPWRMENDCKWNEMLMRSGGEKQTEKQDREEHGNDNATKEDVELNAWRKGGRLLTTTEQVRLWW